MTPTQVFFCEICKIFKNTFSYRTLRWLLLYHCKWNLYRLRILLTSLLDWSIIPCLFQVNFVFFFFWHVFFSSLIPSFSFFTPSKRIRNSFTTIRQVLDVFLYTCSCKLFIAIYSSLFTFNWLYLFTLAYLYFCSLYILFYELDKIVKI